MNRIVAASLPLLASAVLAVACSPVGESEASDEPSRQPLLDTIGEAGSATAPDDCLLYVWSGEEAPDIEFDRAHDTVKGGAISCATGTSPSRFEAAIGALREAAQSGDKARILEQLGIPLLYIDEDGRQQDLSEEQVEALFDDIFDESMLDMLQKLDLSEMTVEKDRGGFFQLGTLWLVVDESGRPQVVTVNRQALFEAAETAREQTELGQGRDIE